ncbi:MAG TPA: 3',5'-cyclic-nucleotide phosphodiesterase [Campylobacterales bacterium]|nr:3',5'-cyclic-nucleotide phosphodiesterase [Campylobacterales bacterium]
MINHIDVLGAYGGKGCGKNTTCFRIAQNIVIDAGNIIAPLKENAAAIEHIFLTHCHLDHIIDIAFLIDAFYAIKTKPLNVYGLKDTIASLKEHILNWKIWPDFSELDLLDKSDKSIMFHEINYGDIFELSGIRIEPFATCHTVASCGYKITKDGRATIITSDTGVCESLLEEIKNTKNLKNLVIECSFPSRFKKLALDSMHLTPALLEEELGKLEKIDFNIYINHLKPFYESEIVSEINGIDILHNAVVLEDGSKIEY